MYNSFKNESQRETQSSVPTNWIALRTSGSDIYYRNYYYRQKIG
jgi:hypothetical protein